MITLKLTEAKALELFPQASNTLKEILEQSAPEGFFKMNIKDRVKTFKDALSIFMEKKFTDELYIALQQRNKNELTCADKLLIIAEVLRNRWKADYSIGNQPKWRPWFEWDNKASGFAFSGSYYDGTNAAAYSGSRLCQETEEMSDYFGTQFLDLHNEFLIIK